MSYTEEQINKYMSYLKPFESVKLKKKTEKVRCRICGSDKCFVESGYNICEECRAVHDALTNHIMTEFIFDKNLFFSENTIMKKS